MPPNMCDAKKARQHSKGPSHNNLSISSVQRLGQQGMRRENSEWSVHLLNAEPVI